MTENISISIPRDNLVDAVVQSDEFGEAVKTVVREEMADDIASILIEEADIFASDEFRDSVVSIVEDNMDRKIEKEVEGLDLSDIIRDAVKEEMPDYQDEIDEIKMEFENRFKILEQQNIKLFQALEAQENNQLDISRYFWNLVKRLRQFPFGKRLFDDFTIGSK